MDLKSLPRTSLTRLNLFEGIVIGIYGNWLISFVDKISFTKALVIGDTQYWLYQPIAVGFSFVCLLLLVGIGVLKEQLLTRGLIVMLAVGHFAANWAAFYVEGYTFSNGFFLAIGTLLFLLIYYSELFRLRELDRRKSLRAKIKKQQEQIQTRD
jgi:4-amino-4-deoxy-L-arabinose transferase-like glycosyltransferase